MLLWLFIGIGVISAIVWLVTLLISSNPLLDQLEKLEEEVENKRWWWYHSHTDENLWKKYQEAQKRLKDFKTQHPNLEQKTSIKDRIRSVASGVMIGAAIISAIMLLIVGINHIGAKAEQIQLEAEYEVLQWEVDNDVYNDNGDDVVGKKELYNQVRDWNSKIRYHQEIEKDFWVGVFVPNIYGDLKLIELK